MKKKTDKETKSMTFMVTKLVTVSGCSSKKAKQIAEEVTGQMPFDITEYYEANGIYVSSATETVIPVEVKK